MKKEATMRTRTNATRCLGMIVVAMGAATLAYASANQAVSTSQRPASRNSVSGFTAVRAGNEVVLEWKTSQEIETAGFELYRVDSTGRRHSANDMLLPAMIVAPQGGSYRYIDKTAKGSLARFYEIVEVTFSDERNIAGRCRVRTGKEDGSRRAIVSGMEYTRMPHDNKEAQLTRLAVEDAAVTGRGSVRSASTGDSVRITILEDGIYTVSAAQIASTLGTTESTVSGWIATGNIELSNRGDSIAWSANDDNSGIVFYGETIDSIYTSENIYWLSEGAGDQMVELGGSAPSPVSDTLTFRDSVHAEVQQYATPQNFWKVGEDFWVWDYLVAGYPGYESKTVTVDLNDPETEAGNATVVVSLLGATDTAANPEHHAVVSLNGTQIGEGIWNGKDSCVITASVSQAVLVDGNNDLSIEALLDQGASYSYVYIDSIDIEYDRKHKATDNNLVVARNDNSVATVSGFSSSAITVLDITDPRTPAIVNAVNVTGSGSYSASFNIASSDSVYVTTVEGNLMVPASIDSDASTGLTDAGNEADYVVITPSQFAAGAGELAALRAAQGMDTMVIDIQDIYDEFNHGIVNPEAIRNFAAHSLSTWEKAPFYVVLVGEGSYDYKNYLGNSDCLIPTMPIKSNEGLLFSDTRLVDVDDDYAPEMSIGRLPVLNAAELTSIIDKIEDFESGGTWKTNVTMIADNPDASGDFPVLADLSASYVSTDMQINKVYLSEHSITEARSMAIEGMNNGCAIMNYIGHAHTTKWADEGILREEDLGSISNPDRAPIVLTMACDFGKFTTPGSDTMSEALMTKSDGGAVASWAAVGLAYSSESRILNEEFVDTVFSSDFARIGDGIVAALTRYSHDASLPNLYYIYNLLGDPATIVVGNVLPADDPGDENDNEYDFGDAPAAQYPTTLESDGARHAAVPGIFLGTSVDAETNACPDSSASGDDQDNSDDEDGVIFSSGLIPNRSTEVTVVASTAGVLNAWIDFNGDGDWSDASEHIFDNEALAAGANDLQFAVPASMVERETYARFRFSLSGNLQPTGEAADGEVEDYEVVRTPTLATVTDFDAFERDGDVVVRWETATESGTAGFMLERQQADGTYRRVTESLVPALFGGPYEVVDPDAEAGNSYTYKLVEHESDGDKNVYGPYTVTVSSEYDQWREEQFSQTQLEDDSVSGDNADADKDGHSNKQEFLAGTDPQNASSVLQVSSVSQSVAGIEVSWQSCPGKSYVIERSAGSLYDFQAVASLDTDAAVTTFTDKNAPAGACFYRVRLAL